MKGGLCRWQIASYFGGSSSYIEPKLNELFEKGILSMRLLSGEPFESLNREDRIVYSLVK